MTPARQHDIAGAFAVCLLIILYVLTSGCYTDTVPLRVCDAQQESCQDISPATDQLLIDAGLILGINIDTRSASRGVVLSILVDTDDPYAGRSIRLKGYPCLRVIRSTRDPQVLAHEIGHALGLRHPCRLENSARCGRGSPSNICNESNDGDLMHPAVEGEWLSQSEHEQIEKGVRALERCRGE